jgi:uncharacterized integral membrane protein (TIGR02327 family)
MVNPIVFDIARLILFFVATLFVYNALQALDLGKLFKPNSTNQIRFIYMVLSVILGYLFVDAFVSLFETMNSLF